MTKPHVVIVGGGFGGLAAARGLSKAPVRVTLVDARNHHLFQPLLYQVATAGLSPGDIAEPIRGVLRRQANAEVLLGSAERVDVAGRMLHLTDEALGFDYLVVATGAKHSYFGQDGWAPYAPGLKTVEDALEIRRRVLLAYERAERSTVPADQAAYMTFCVVGGGPTGVELAGALAELARHTLARDFRRIDPKQARVILFEGSDRILSAFDPDQSAKAQKMLERLGVEVRLGQFVSDINDEQLTVGEEVTPTRTVLWAAGVAGSPLAQTLDAPLDRAGRVLVDPDLRLPNSERVFVIGDLAAVPQDGSWVPGVAPAAIQGGQHAAKQIKNLLAGDPTTPFRYVDKGSMATIGRSKAIAKIGRLKLSGWPAWAAWLSVHIMFLIGFRNRVLVLFQWSWAYWTFQRGARLITRQVESPRVERERRASQRLEALKEEEEDANRGS